LKQRIRRAVAAIAALAWAGFAVACTSSSESPANSAQTLDAAGTGDDSSASSSGASNIPNDASSGSTSEASTSATPTDANTSDVAGDGGGSGIVYTTDAGLYGRLGEHAGVEAAARDIIAAEAADPEIGTFFFAQRATPAPAGHPTLDQIEACLANYLGKSVGGREAYPSNVTTSTGTFACRDMTTAHAALHISTSAFDKFLMIAAGVLSAPPYNVASSDLSTIDADFNSEQFRIIDQGAIGSTYNDAGP
jgi:hypothetical protein